MNVPVSTGATNVDELERTRLIKALHAKGLPLSRLARENLAFDGRFIVFDGRNLCAYPDAAEGHWPRQGGSNAAVCSICLRSVRARRPAEKASKLWHRRPEFAPDNSLACQRIDALVELIERHCDRAHRTRRDVPHDHSQMCRPGLPRHEPLISQPLPIILI